MFSRFSLHHGSYMDAKYMGNEQNFCIQWKDKDPKIHLNSPGQPVFGPLRTHPVGDVITLISTQLFLLYAGQDH